MPGRSMGFFSVFSRDFAKSRAARQGTRPVGRRAAAAERALEKPGTDVHSLWGSIPRRAPAARLLRTRRPDVDLQALRIERF